MWERRYDEVVECLRLAKELYRDGEWTPGDTDRAAAQSVRHSTAKWSGLVGRPWLERSRFLLGLEEPCRAAATTSTGPLPMLLTTTADLAAQLAEPVSQVTRAWENRDPAVPVGKWELTCVRDDWWRQADSTGVAVHRVATLLGSLHV